MVEFAIVASLLLLLLFAIVDFSRLFFAYATMAHGTREAARWGIVHTLDEYGQPNSAAITDLAESRMVVLGGEPVVEVSFPGPPEDPEDPDRDPFPNEPYCAHYCPLVVTAKVTLDVWTPVLPSVYIEAFATMHIE
jgi:hypothetical protein